MSHRHHDDMKSLAEVTLPIQRINIIRNLLTEDGPFPNNGLLPLLLYPQACQIHENQDHEIIKELLETNGWTDSWIDGVYDYHHYHSTAHEVLISLAGSARIQFGGPNGVTLNFEKGDVIIIPAGVAHCRLSEANEFSCMGAYPSGQKYDMNYGKTGERPQVDENIRNVPLPGSDPIYGTDGPLVKNWFSAKDQHTDTL